MNYYNIKNQYRYLMFENKGIYRRYIDNEKIKEQEEVFSKMETHGTYGGLLFREEWKNKRDEIIKRDGSCKICNSITDLQVHHRQYHFLLKEKKFKLPWEYSNKLLITLCENCHRRGHNKYKVPIINI